MTIWAVVLLSAATELYASDGKIKSGTGLDLNYFIRKKNYTILIYIITNLFMKGTVYKIQVQFFTLLSIYSYHI